MRENAFAHKNMKDTHESNLTLSSINVLNEASDHGLRNIKAEPRTSVRSEVRMGRAENESGLIWVTTIFMAIFHIGAVAALFFFSWTNLIAAIVLYIFAVNCGIGMGYHRLLVHRGYQVPKAIEYILAVCGSLSLEGGPIAWVATHRVHHQHSDREGDPHTPQEGTWWSHMGWIISGRALNAETSGACTLCARSCQGPFPRVA